MGARGGRFRERAKKKEGNSAESCEHKWLLAKGIPKLPENPASHAGGKERCWIGVRIQTSARGLWACTGDKGECGFVVTINGGRVCSQAVV